MTHTMWLLHKILTCTSHHDVKSHLFFFLVKTQKVFFEEYKIFLVNLNEYNIVLCKEPFLLECWCIIFQKNKMTITTNYIYVYFLSQEDYIHLHLVPRNKNKKRGKSKTEKKKHHVFFFFLIVKRKKKKKRKHHVETSHQHALTLSFQKRWPT